MVTYKTEKNLDALQKITKQINDLLPEMKLEMSDQKDLKNIVAALEKMEEKYHDKFYAELNPKKKGV